ncbi:MAG TPA: aminopeptidase [Thermoplasmata archaeon]|nr:aminopeptidase [Thermoplasmata archaeon]
MAEPSVPEARRRQAARSILTRNLKVRRGERVLVEGWTHSLPWSVALVREARRLGAQTLLVYEDEAEYWDGVEHGLVEVLGTVGSHEWAALSETDVYIHLWGPGDRQRFAELPQKTQDRLLSWNEPWYKAAHKAGVRGARLEFGRVYPSLARAYGADEATWMDQLIRGSVVDPTRLARMAAPLERALTRGKRLRIRHSNGTDLTLGLRHRPAVVNVGSVPKKPGPFGMLVTLPSGSVRVALDERVADGTVVSNRTNYYDAGIATGGVLRFRKGKLVDHSFETGAELFDAPYRTGGTGRDRPGMFGVGLNPGLHNTPQLEDVERGALLVSVGGNRFSGGQNRSPFFGFVIVADADVEVDGRPLRV